MSDPLSYYRTAHLLVPNEWLHNTNGDPAYRAQLWTMGDMHPLHYIYRGSPSERYPSSNHGFLNVYPATLKQIQWHGCLSKETPLWTGASRPEVAALLGSEGCDTLGISSLGTVLTQATLKSFTDLQEDFSLVHRQSTNFYSFDMSSSPISSIYRLFPTFIH